MKCCIECVASSAYSCFSRTTLTVLAVLKVLISVSIIVIVAVKLENVTIAVQLPVSSLADLTTVAGLANVTSSLLGTTPPAAGGASGAGAGGAGGTDLNATAGPIHVDAACLLQKRGDAGQFDGDSKTMCSYVYGVCAISLVATFAMASLLWCTCHLCGWGPLLELLFAVLGLVWWMVAALVLQEHTAISVDTGPAAVRLIVGNALPPPPAAVGALFSPPPPPALPPSGNATGSDGDLAAQLGELLHEWMPTSLNQWRNTVVGLSWTMMVMFGAAGLLLAVEACGCLVEVVACCCRCCCCPNRPESKWRSRFSNTKRKRVDGEEYMEMAAGIPNSSAPPSGGGAVPLSSPPPGPAAAASAAAAAGPPPGGYGYGSGGHGFGPGAYSGGRGAYSSASAAAPSVVVVARSDGYAARSWADRDREEREKRAPGGWGY